MVPMLSTPWSDRLGAAPTLGQHTDEVLREAGVASETIAQLAGQGVIFRGLANSPMAYGPTQR